MPGQVESARSNLAFWGFIKDPIHGYIRLTEVERRIIDTFPVQRLRRIRQLAGAEYVYPAANHTRFEHVIGAMHLAGLVAENLPAELSGTEKQQLRLAALLHDVGHAPFSHLFEPLLAKYLKKNHEAMSSWIISDSSLTDVIAREGFEPKILSQLAVGKLQAKGKQFLNQVISGSFDVDKMDFILRDSYHTGAGYGFVDIYRLIYTMDVLDGNMAADITALPALESLILARLESFKAIYFHRACRAVQLMLLDALNAAKDDLDILRVESAEEYLEWDDYTVWSRLKANRKSRPILRAISERKLLKCAYEKTFYAKDELASNVFTKENVRTGLEDEIASYAKIDASDVKIDVPTLPTVPYHYAIQTDPANIPIFSRAPSGAKTPRKITELSTILDALRLFMNIIRIYTREEYRKRVGEASAKVLGEPPLSNIISY